MGLDTALGSLLAAFGLSGAAGLNAWLPLFLSALLARLDVIELASPFDELSSTTSLVVLGVLTGADFVGDKIPVVDHALHGIGTVVAPASGAVLFTGQTGLETDLPTLVAILLGGVTAETIHLGRAGARPAATVATGGLGNPVLSLAEDAGSGFLTAVAFLLPLLAVLVLAAGVTLVVWRQRKGAARVPAAPLTGPGAA
jgi:hypothetical protein